MKDFPLWQPPSAPSNSASSAAPFRKASAHTIEPENPNNARDVIEAVDENDFATVAYMSGAGWNPEL